MDLSFFLRELFIFSSFIDVLCEILSGESVVLEFLNQEFYHDIGVVV